MRSDQQMVMERQPVRTVERSAAASTVKSIFLQIVDDERCDQRIDTALALARAHSAHLSCLHVTPIEAYVAFDTFGGIFVMNDVMEKLEAHDRELREKIEARLATEDVSWDYEQVTGNVASTMISRLGLADLLVVARQPAHKDFVGPTIGFLGDLLARSRTPLFIPGSSVDTFDPTGRAVIAWNGSMEAANAVRSSLGLLRLAKDVRVLQIQERAGDPLGFPGTRLLEYLSRQGIHAELMSAVSPTADLEYDSVSGMIISQALGAGAAFIVMGGYSHSRFAEYVLGGVTRTLLKDCPVALVIAH